MISQGSIKSYHRPDLSVPVSVRRRAGTMIYSRRSGKYLRRRIKLSPEERTQVSQEHPRTFVAADGMPISKERRRRRYCVPGLPEAPQPLPDPRELARGLVYDVTSFLKQALLVADIHAAHTLAQHGEVPDKHTPRSIAT
jgi:hypothetical protein